MLTLEVVFFDLGDTLVHLLDRVWLTATGLLLGVNGSQFNQPRIQSYVQLLKLAHQKYLRVPESIPQRPVKNDVDELELWHEYFVELLKRSSIICTHRRLEMTADYLAASSIDGACFECFDDVYPALQQLADIQVKLAVISNAHPSAKRILQHTQLERQFHGVFLSYEIGYTKPSVEIYNYALENANVSGDQALFLDDRAKFLKLREGAKLPMNAMLVNRGYAYLETWGGDVISDLTELKNLISANRSKSGPSDKQSMARVSK